MELKEALRARKSIRGYLPDPIPKKILADILSLALRAPSAINSQPWEIVVATGETLEKIKQGNIQMAESGIWPHPDIPMPRFTEVHRKRQLALGAQLYGLMGIERDDMEKNIEWGKKSLRFFDAPALIIILSDRALEVTNSAFDCGLLTQNIALLALEYGLGTCINQQGVFYPEVIRTYTDIPDSKRIIICIDIGYPDWIFPANKINSDREPLEKITTWHGFEP